LPLRLNQRAIAAAPVGLDVGPAAVTVTPDRLATE
jgi:hypothetical protein